MEPVAEIVAALESRGVRFYADSVGVRFACDDAGSLLPGDPARLSEIVLDRADETLDFLGHRNRPTGFGAYAGIFRAALYRFRTPAGLLPWMRERCPSLYADLTARLPDRMQRLWEGGASIEEFTPAVGLLEEQHRVARGFYLACRGEDDGRER